MSKPRKKVKGSKLKLEEKVQTAEGWRRKMAEQFPEVFKPKAVKKTKSRKKEEK